MKELVLDIVACCENRISMVEELITGAYYSTATLDANLAEVVEERVRLKTGMQEVLARNCSLRRKDFNSLMERITTESERKKEELEGERKHIREELKGYLDEQKELVTSLRQQLVDFTYEKTDRDALEGTINKIKTAYQQNGGQVSALLQDFQVRLEAFRNEQEEINHKLRRLADRGESLQTEDLRQLEAARAHQERKVERRRRQQAVERLLAHFKEQRQEDSRYRRHEN